MYLVSAVKALNELWRDCLSLPAGHVTSQHHEWLLTSPLPVSLYRPSAAFRYVDLCAMLNKIGYK